MKWVNDNQAVIVTTVAFKTDTADPDGVQVSGHFVLRVAHRLDESKLPELLARYGLATVFSAVGENSLLGNGKSEQGNSTPAQ